MQGRTWFRRAMLVAAVGVLWGCTDRAPAPEAASERPAGSAQAPGGEGEKSRAADPSVVAASGTVMRYLSVGAPGRISVREEQRIPGRLETNENRTARIGAPVTGRVVAIQGVVGQRVNMGEVLAQISSPELSSAQLAFLKAHSAEQLAQRAAERARLLLEADVIGAAELQRRESELAVARAESQAARDQLRVLGLSSALIDRLMQTGQIIASAPITATKTGTIIERRGALGQVVQPSDELFTVTDLGALWAVADVPEQEARQARVGQRVEVEVPALGDRRVEGAISYVSDLVNPETRTIRVRMELPNPSGEFKPAMLASMLLKGPERERLVVPKSALVREENRDLVFVAEEGERFRLRQVKLGTEVGDSRVVLDGLRSDERIVTAGAFHLNNERRQLAVGGR